MIDPPPIIGPTSPLRRVERTARDGDPGRRPGEHGGQQKQQDDHEPEREDGDGLHVDVRV